MKIANKLLLTVLILSIGALSACGKPRLFGKDMKVNPIIQNYPIDPKLAFQSAKEALAYNGYNIQTEDPKLGTMETHWQPSTSDSHYVNFFDRQDRGTVGSYYKLILKITPRGNGGSQVEISSLAKSIISNLESTGIEEEKVLKKIADYTRKQNIEVTNVGIQ